MNDDEEHALHEDDDADEDVEGEAHGADFADGGTMLL
jgi:hypothetical protein